MYEPDPYEAIRVRESIRDPADAQVDLTLKPSSVVEIPSEPLAKLVCFFCSSISVDPV
jgi:hypothetical protein